MKKDLGQKKGYTVFFDFDNTITTYDVLDDMIERFAEDGKCGELEEKWLKGEIGSRECLKGQMENLRIDKRTIDKYLGSVKIDPYFKKLKKYLDSRDISAYILTDNFDYILERVLENHGIKGLPVFSNKLKIVKDRLKTSFPLTNDKCGKCGHCKKTSLLDNARKGTFLVYVGDGRSDIDPAGHADIVFAKDDLKDHFERNKREHVPIKGLRDVYNYFKRNLL
jgi:2-hydroxy-3-keto-5-methylthiopentenyl-1-phosphate phosphatase